MRKAVMVLLADKASDNGRGIYASKQTMADELCTSKQTVITVIKELQAEGLLMAVGKNKIAAGYTVEYAINVSKLEALPLVKCHADRQSRGLTSQTALPVKDDDQTSQAALPDQSSCFTQTIHEPSNNRKDKSLITTRTKKGIEKPDSISDSVWRDWLIHRKDPITETALKGFEREVAKAGWSLEAAIAESIERKWQGFKADWIKDNGHNGRNGNNRSGNNRPVNGFAAALRQVADGPFDGPAADDGWRV